MYFILSFALLLIVLSAYMALYPKKWASGIVRFSQWSYFHIFEIVSRLFIGLGLIYFANQNMYPKLITTIGYLFVAVSIGLALTPSTKHRQFAAWTADKFLHVFRTAGIASMCLGVFLIHITITSNSI